MAYENGYGGGGSTKKSERLFSLFGIGLEASSKNLNLVKFRIEASDIHC